MSHKYIHRYNGLPLIIRHYDKNIKFLQPGFYEQKESRFTKQTIIYILPRKFKKRRNKSKKWKAKEDKRISDYFTNLLANDSEV